MKVLRLQVKCVFFMMINGLDLIEFILLVVLSFLTQYVFFLGWEL